MGATRRQGKELMPRGNSVPGDNLRFIHNAHAEPGEVVVAVAVEARHLCRFAAGQGTAGQLAGRSDPLNDRGSLLYLELTRGEIIEE